MNAEELLEDLPKDNTQDVAIEQQHAERKILSAILQVVAAKHLVRELQISDIDGMNPLY